MARDDKEGYFGVVYDSLCQRNTRTDKGIDMKITAEQCVRALKQHGLSTSAKNIAVMLGNTDSRAVATALRKPTRDGRVSWTFKKGIAFYRFVRLKAKEST